MDITDLGSELQICRIMLENELCKLWVDGYWIKKCILEMYRIYIYSYIYIYIYIYIVGSGVH